MSRVSIGKRLRFDVFKRDEFACVYCGAHPPDALLEVDHVHPVADGGTNEIDNLVTACFGCNRGKAAIPLSSVPQSMAEKAAETQERENQLLSYYKVLKAKKDRKDEELWGVADVFIDRFNDDGIMRVHLASIRKFLDRLNYFEVLEAMEIAVDKMWERDRAFRYFSGICWRKIKEKEEGAE